MRRRTRRLGAAQEEAHGDEAAVALDKGLQTGQPRFAETSRWRTVLRVRMPKTVQQRGSQMCGPMILAGMLPTPEKMMSVTRHERRRGGRQDEGAQPTKKTELWRGQRKATDEPGSAHATTL